MRSRAEFAAALLIEIVGAAVVLLVGTREWQTITTSRARPFHADVLSVSGRTIDGAPTALALVALAGVVAVLATKGVARRAIGVLVAIAGAGIVWRSATAMGAVSASRARDLVRDKHPRVLNSATAAQQVATHSGWAVLSIVGGVLVVAAGVLIAWRGGSWSAMSARYEAPVRAKEPDPEQARAKADASLWAALERGEDPTARDPRDAR
jgi:uncharacterized membrane protein (TIGR02234 family)